MFAVVFSVCFSALILNIYFIEFHIPPLKGILLLLKHLSTKREELWVNVAGEQETEMQLRMMIFQYLSSHCAAIKTSKNTSTRKSMFPYICERILLLKSMSKEARLNCAQRGHCQSIIQIKAGLNLAVVKARRIYRKVQLNQRMPMTLTRK